jgi:hypothetical protein
VFAVLLAAFALPAGANATKEFGMAETLARSDTVVVGVLEESRDETGKLVEARGHVRIRVQYAIKGAPPAVIVLDTAPDISEQSVSCCTPRVRYLMFLVRGPTGMYASVNGRYGVYPLKD